MIGTSSKYIGAGATNAGSDQQGIGTGDHKHVIVSLSAGVACCTSRPRKRVKSDFA